MKFVCRKFCDFKIYKRRPPKFLFSKLFFHHSLAKTFLLKYLHSTTSLHTRLPPSTLDYLPPLTRLPPSTHSTTSLHCGRTCFPSSRLQRRPSGSPLQQESITSRHLRVYILHRVKLFIYRFKISALLLRISSIIPV